MDLLYIYNYVNDNLKDLYKDFQFISRNEKLIDLKEYILSLNTDGFYAGQFELYVSAKIFNIDIIILEYNDNYKGYILKNRFELDDESKPILFLEYKVINRCGHFNILHIKHYQNIISNIKDIPYYLNNKFNQHYLRKINEISFKTEINTNKSNKSNNINNNFNIINEENYKIIKRNEKYLSIKLENFSITCNRNIKKDYNSENLSLNNLNINSNDNNNKIKENTELNNNINPLTSPGEVVSVFTSP